MTADDERNAAIKARDILATLSPTTERTDPLVHSLRMVAVAAVVATDASKQSEAALNNIRREAATALNGAAALLHVKALTLATIDSAGSAVAAWLSALQ
jgi:hypothetical protein